MTNNTGGSKQHENKMLISFLMRTGQIQIIAFYTEKERKYYHILG